MMKKISLWLSTLILGFMNLGFSSDLLSWQKLGIGMNVRESNCIVVHPQDHNLLFVGTDKVLYRSTNKGLSFQPVLQLHSSSRGINYIYIAETPAAFPIYAATGGGLFQSHDNGDTWEKIFDPQEDQISQCLSVITFGETIYAGTLNGLFYKSLSDPTWQRLKGELGRQPIYELAKDKQYLYIVTDSQFYRVKEDIKEVHRTFSLGSQEESTNNRVSQEDNQRNRKIKDLLFERETSSLFLATIQGINYSHDQGKTWDRILSDGLPLSAIQSILVLNKKNLSHGAEAESKGETCFPLGGFGFFAGTQQGFFYRDNDHWQPLYRGMETNDVRFLSADNQGNFYAATDRGIFLLPVKEAFASAESKVASQESDVKGQKSQDPGHVARGTGHGSEVSAPVTLPQEPTILEVQEMAIKYADVHPNKIKRWYSALKKKAILPTLSVGLDRADGEFFHWDTGANPDLLLKGRDHLDWDLSLSWDLADLVWDNDMTSIDSRSKLMVELREDILDQVTRIYFERKRIQMELGNDTSLDPKVRLEKQMRIEELTALIDGLTGGEFSRGINK